MSEFLGKIYAADQLINWFGHWPNFHDAEVMWIKLERGIELLQGNVRIEFLVHAWEWISLRKNINHSELGVQNRCLVHFAFENCANILLEDFNQQNQLSAIRFTVEKQTLQKNKIAPTNAVVYIQENQQYFADEILTVEFVSEFGLSGGFNCYTGKIVSITACKDNGIPLVPT
jgi:hypothetical protein